MLGLVGFFHADLGTGAGGVADFLDVGVLASIWVLGSSWRLEFPLVTGVK